MSAYALEFWFGEGYWQYFSPYQKSKKISENGDQHLETHCTVPNAVYRGYYIDNRECRGVTKGRHLVNSRGASVADISSTPPPIFFHAAFPFVFFF